MGNLNGDNTTDGADVAIVYNNWATNNAQADINNDGTVDGADLAEVSTAGVKPTSVQPRYQNLPVSVSWA